MSIASAPEWEVHVAGGIAPDAACIDGHFPGRPIVPGAILLGHGAHALASKGYDLVAVRRMKFLKPLKPGRPFAIRVIPRSAHTELAWLDGETVFARATVILHPHDK